MTDLEIKAYLDQFDLDLRKSKDGTALDMKDTPDIVSYIADCIMNFADCRVSQGEKIEDVTFSVTQIWHTDYAIQTAVQVFGKPSPNSDAAVQEYNKFFTLPMKALAYSRVLEAAKVGRNYSFKISNYELLDYIASRDNNAAKFLALYFEKVLSDSDLFKVFDQFFSEQTKDSLANARKTYVQFMFDYGLKGQKGGKGLEAEKTFIKLINILAYDRRKSGIARGGGVTQEAISLQQIRYNEANSRDIAKGKPKGITRIDHAVSPAALARTEYAITRAKQSVDRFNKAFNHGKVETVSTVLRKSAKLNSIDKTYEVSTTIQDATDKHHIFPSADYPSISTYYENIICITSGQHLDYAHPGHNPHAIDSIYQYYLILSKMEQIMRNLLDGIGTPNFYSFRKFTKVLDVGLSTEAFEQIPINDFDSVSSLVDSYY